MVGGKRNCASCYGRLMTNHVAWCLLFVGLVGCSKPNPTMRDASDGMLDGGVEDLSSSDADAAAAADALDLAADDGAGSAADLTGAVTAPDLGGAPSPADLAGTPGGSCAHYQFNPYTTDKDWSLWPLAMTATGTPAITTNALTVLDPRTGLEWQRATSTSSNATNDYEAADADAYCDALALDGHSDWRLPSFAEVLSIAKLDQFPAPTIDPTLFPDTREARYWTSSFPNVAFDAQRISFDFADGTTLNAASRKHHVRCVRVTCAGAALPVPHFTDAGTTVRDNFTGLEWQKNVESNTGPETMNATAAKQFCGTFGGAWRVPTVNELVSLVDLAKPRFAAALDPLFAEPPTREYWAFDGRVVATWSLRVLAMKDVNSKTFTRCVR